MEQTIKLTDISPRAWEHPADRAALASLRAVPGLEALVRTVFGTLDDTTLRLFLLASCIRTGKRQLPRIHSILETCAGNLDMEVPELYVSNNPVFNAMAMGLDKPALVLHSGLVEGLGDGELGFIIGHELGHVASGHGVYRTLIWVLQNLGHVLIPQGIPQLLGAGLWVALMEWYRKAELSCDRAGLLATQDEASASRALIRMAGGRGTGPLDEEAFMDQAAEFHASQNILEDALKLLITLGQTHPFPVARFTELTTWQKDGSYRKILDGGYPKRSDGYRSSTMAEDFGDLGSKMKSDWDAQSGPLKDMADQAGKAFAQGLKDLDKALGGFFGDKRD